MDEKIKALKAAYRNKKSIPIIEAANNPGELTKGVYLKWKFKDDEDAYKFLEALQYIIS